MTNILFRFNCIYDYNILQPHILWGFRSDQEIFLENIKDIFPIKVQTGNAKLRAQVIQMTNVNISNSIGSGLYISLEDKANCSMCYIQFSSIKLSFQENNENGGAIIFDTTLSLETIITLQTIKLSNILCRQKGGFIYLINGQGKSQTLISNLILQDVYALQGSIIYSEFSAQSSKLISLENVQLNNSHTGRMHFLNQFIYDLEELQQLSYLRYLICIQNAQTIKIINFIVKNLNYESLLQISNTIQIQITKLITSESIFLNAAIKIDSKNSKSSLFMRDSQISNISTFASIPDQFECTVQQINLMPYQSFSCLKETFAKQSPKNLPSFYDNVLDARANCVLHKMKTQQRNQNLSAVNINPFKSNITISQILFQDINCETCENGLLNIDLKESQSHLDIKSLHVQKNKCGQSSCINIINNIQSRRRLQKLIPYPNSKTYQVNLLSLISDHTCLRVQNTTTLIISSIFKNNIAVNKGGTILVLGIEDFYIKQSIISDNVANIGGGIFMDDQINQNMTLLGSIVLDNIAKQYGNNEAQVPSQLAISVDTVNYLPKTNILETDNLVVEQIQIKEYEVMKNVFSNSIYFPNGQAIADYQYFDWKKAEYQPYNLHLRIIALDRHNSIIKNLDQTQCSIKGRLYQFYQKLLHFLYLLYLMMNQKGNSQLILLIQRALNLRNRIIIWIK